MSKVAKTIEAALERIRQDSKSGIRESEATFSINVPEDLRRDGFQSVVLSEEERAHIDRAIELLGEDLRFEYLKARDARNLVHRFACLAQTDEPETSQQFVDDHARVPKKIDCFLDVEFLTVEKEVELFGVTFLPASKAPSPKMFGGAVEVTGVIAVASEGTNHQKMIDRAKNQAAYALRLLRTTLREHQMIPEGQLRFRLGEHAWFDETQVAWKRSPESGMSLALDDELAGLARSQPISDISMLPKNDVERRIQLSLEWLDKAQLELDPTTTVLFGFFALESILGSTSEGLKGIKLAHRRALLGAVASGQFTSPDRMFYLYDSVRSQAVHGEGSGLVTEKEARIFLWDIRRAINEFRTYAQSNSLTSRKAVRESLAAHPDAGRMKEHLLNENPKLWGSHFSGDA